MNKKDIAFKRFKKTRRVFSNAEAKKIPEINWQLEYALNTKNSKWHIYSKEEDLSNAFFIEEQNNKFYCFVDRGLYTLDSLAECEQVFFDKLEEYLGNEIIEEFTN